MLKVVIFGAGDLGQALYERIKHNSEVLFFVDNNHKNATDSSLDVLAPTALLACAFDLVYIAAAEGLEEIYAQLLDMGIPKHKINRVWGESTRYEKNIAVTARIRFLEQYAEHAYYHGIPGNVAECGVYRGEFAKEINRVFPDRKLYLFDTFEGFDQHDLNKEQEMNPRFDHLREWIDTVTDFSDTSIDIVVGKLPYPNQCVIKQGCFPETFTLEDDTFAFVNLDMDLYAPIKAGLELFYPRLSVGGVILVHDYYSPTGGVNPAVDEFLHANQLSAIPVGDYKSVAVVKMERTSFICPKR